MFNKNVDGWLLSSSQALEDVMLSFTRNDSKEPTSVMLIVI
jgi:hypothetical protein